MFTSLRPTLEICNDVNTRLAVIGTICELSEYDWKCMMERKISEMHNLSHKNVIEPFAADMGTLLLHVDTSIALLSKHQELTDLPLSSCLEETHGAMWKQYITQTRQQCESLHDDVKKLEEGCLKWYNRLSDKEDTGSTSSYSDYSDGDTSTSDDEKDDSGSDSGSN